jgi:hypothetical protein
MAYAAASCQPRDSYRIGFQRLGARLCGDSVMKPVKVTTAKATMAKSSTYTIKWRPSLGSSVLALLVPQKSYCFSTTY